MYTGNEPLLDFHFADDKLDPKYGLSIARWIDSTLRTGYNGYYMRRNERFRTNRLWADAKVPMEKFLDLMEIKGTKAYVNLDFRPPAIMPKYIKQIMDVFMDTEEMADANALDINSIKRKEKERKEAIFRMKHAQEIAQLQRMAGVQVEDPSAFVPRDSDELDLFFDLEYKLPEEAIIERRIQDVWDINKPQELKRICCSDLTKTGLGCIRIWRDKNGNIRLRRIKPENFFYSYTEYSDFRDCAFMGEVYNMPVVEFRKRFSDVLSEKEIFDIANKYGQGQNKSQLAWNEEYYINYFRPYDDWTIPMLNFEVKADNILYVKEKITETGIPIIDYSYKKPNKVGENTTVTGNKLDRIYTGWYVRNTDMVLDWRRSPNKIIPSNNLSEEYFSYCPYIQEATDMVTVALPELMEPPATQMIVCILKIQQLIAKMRPAGWIYDIAGMMDLDIGDGKPLNPLELKEIHQQTGDMFYSSIADDGETRLTPPIQPTANNEASQQIMQLINTYNFNLEQLQSFIGTNPAASGMQVSSRMGIGVMKEQMRVANSSSNNIYEGWLSISEQIAQKIAIMEWDNIVYDTSAYRSYMDGSEDINDEAYFRVRMKMLPNEQERAYLEGLIQTAVTAQIIDIDQAYKIRNIKNTKLGEMYLGRAQKESKAQAIAAQSQAIQENGQQQQQSAAMNMQMQESLERAKGANKLQAAALTGTQNKNLELQKFVAQAMLESMKPGAVITPEVMAMINMYLALNQPSMMQNSNQAGDQVTNLINSNQAIDLQQQIQDKVMAAQQQQAQAQGVEPQAA